MTLAIRRADPGDGAALHAMVKARAESHGYGDHVFAIPRDYEDGTCFNRLHGEALERLAS